MTTYFLWYRTFRDWQYGHQEVAAYLKSTRRYDRIVMTKWYGNPAIYRFLNLWDPKIYQAQTLFFHETEHAWLDQLRNIVSVIYLQISREYGNT